MSLIRLLSTSGSALLPASLRCSWFTSGMFSRNEPLVTTITWPGLARARVVREGEEAGVPGVRVLAFGGSNPEWTEWARQADAHLAERLTEKFAQRRRRPAREMVRRIIRAGMRLAQRALEDGKDPMAIGHGQQERAIRAEERGGTFEEGARIG